MVMANNKHHYYYSLIKGKRLLDYIFIKYLATVRGYTAHSLPWGEQTNSHTPTKEKEKSSSIITARKKRGAHFYVPFHFDRSRNIPSCFCAMIRSSRRRWFFLSSIRVTHEFGNIVLQFIYRLINLSVTSERLMHAFQPNSFYDTPQCHHSKIDFFPVYTHIINECKNEFRINFDVRFLMNDFIQSSSAECSE